MNEFKRSYKDMSLKPEWFKKPGPLRTLHDEGIIAYLAEIKVLQEKQKVTAKEKTPTSNEDISCENNNLFDYEYPKYDKFYDFIDDNGEDYSYNKRQLPPNLFLSTFDTTRYSYSIAPVVSANK